MSASLKTVKSSDLTPCIICSRALNADGLPLFYRFAIQRCGLDKRAIDERVGLAGMWGNMPGAGVLAEVFASRDPAAVIDDYRPVCVCHQCADTTSGEALFLAAMAQQPAEPA